MTALRLIADDLTGALDTAAQFTGRIGPLPVLLDRMTAAPEASYALNLSCRDGDERTAVACTRDSLGCYSGADVAFKKIDSLLRGHWPRSWPRSSSPVGSAGLCWRPRCPLKAASRETVSKCWRNRPAIAY